MKVMKHTQRFVLLMTLGLVFLVASMPDASPPRKKQPLPGPRFVQPIKSDAQTWVEARIEAGNDVCLSANYLFQAMKMRTQAVLIRFESDTLYHTLIETMDGVKGTGIKGQALVFVEMARRLLNPAADIDDEVAPEVKKRLEAFEQDPQNTPRGHYASTEDLSRYFRAMQLLTKATFDVKVNQRWFAERSYMLFSFDAGKTLVTALAEPQNQAVSDRFNQIHLFYERLVGSPDLPSFHDLLADKVKLDPESVLEYAKTKGLPQINKEMGVGVQCLGERFTAHQSVIDNLSERFLAPDVRVSRNKAFEVLRFKNVFSGRKEGRIYIPGLVSAKVPLADPTVSFYDLCLGATVNLPLNIASDYYRLNTAAAGVTALAEQTILVTKQTTLVPKSAVIDEEKRKRANIHVQPRIEKFLEYLKQADQRLHSLCGQELRPDAYETLIKASITGKPIQSDSKEAGEVIGLFGSLAQDPTVTADVFYFSGQFDKGFLQWAIAPFEVEYTLANKTKVKGMEMVFFEGWNDTVSKDAKRPLTNEAWGNLFAQGEYKKFKSVLKVP